MSLSASRALAQALRSTLWLIAYYTNVNGPGPDLRYLKLAMGRAIAELEAEAAGKVSGASQTAGSDNIVPHHMKSSLTPEIHTRRDNQSR